MGMTCALYRASADELARLIANPDTLEDFITGIEGPPLPVREIQPRGLLGLLYRLSPITITEVVPDPDRPDPEPPDPERTLDIEKGWHGLHYLLTESADEAQGPGSLLVYGGEMLDDEGVARALGPAEVRSLAQHMTGLSTAVVRQRYDPVRMTELDIYPGVWDRVAEGDQPRDWLLACFEDVRTFMGKAAAAGDGIVVQIS